MDGKHELCRTGKNPSLVVLILVILVQLPFARPASQAWAGQRQIELDATRITAFGGPPCETPVFMTFNRVLGVLAHVESVVVYTKCEAVTSRYIHEELVYTATIKKSEAAQQQQKQQTDALIQAAKAVLGGKLAPSPRLAFALEYNIIASLSSQHHHGDIDGIRSSTAMARIRSDSVLAEYPNKVRMEIADNFNGDHEGAKEAIKRYVRRICGDKVTFELDALHHDPAYYSSYASGHPGLTGLPAKQFNAIIHFSQPFDALIFCIRKDSLAHQGTGGGLPVVVSNGTLSALELGSGAPYARLVDDTLPAQLINEHAIDVNYHILGDRRPLADVLRRGVELAKPQLNTATLLLAVMATTVAVCVQLVIIEALAFTADRRQECGRACRTRTCLLPARLLTGRVRSARDLTDSLVRKGRRRYRHIRRVTYRWVVYYVLTPYKGRPTRKRAEAHINYHMHKLKTRYKKYCARSAILACPDPSTLRARVSNQPYRGGNGPGAPATERRAADCNSHRHIPMGGGRDHSAGPTPKGLNENTLYPLHSHMQLQQLALAAVAHLNEIHSLLQSDGHLGYLLLH